MTKKHFIALADMIKANMGSDSAFGELQIDELADFCQSTNSNFKRDRWIGYIYDHNGKNGGKVK